jgi:hypothetical protein
MITRLIPKIFFNKMSEGIDLFIATVSDSKCFTTTARLPS